MPTTRETILQTLLAALQTVPGATVLREEVLPECVPAGGLVILRDGDPGAPEVTLSPLAYHYEHRAETEVIVQGKTPAARANAFDTARLPLRRDAALQGQFQHLRADARVARTERRDGNPGFLRRELRPPCFARHRNLAPDHGAAHRGRYRRAAGVFPGRRWLLRRRSHVLLGLQDRLKHARAVHALTIGERRLTVAQRKRCPDHTVSVQFQGSNSLIRLCLWPLTMAVRVFVK